MDTVVTNFVNNPTLITFMTVAVVGLGVAIVFLCRWFGRQVLTALKDNTVAITRLTDVVENMQQSQKDLHNLISQILIKKRE